MAAPVSEEDADTGAPEAGGERTPDAGDDPDPDEDPDPNPEADVDAAGPTAPDHEAALELLGDPTRAAIVRELAAAREGDLPPALSFSALRARVAPEGRSSRFNYHLQRLVGTVVERRESGSAQPVERFAADEVGYALTPAGTHLARTLTALTSPPDPAYGPVETRLDCHHCGSRVRADYTDRTVRIRCPDCGHLYRYTLTPPGVVADDPPAETFLDRVGAYLRRKYHTFARGACPLCAGGLAVDRVDPATLDWPQRAPLEVLVRRRCTHCRNLNYATLGTEAAVDAGVVAWAAAHGLDLTRTRLWRVPWVATDRTLEVVDRVPWRAELSLTAGDAETWVRLDGRGTVVDRGPGVPAPDAEPGPDHDAGP